MKWTSLLKGLKEKVGLSQQLQLNIPSSLSSTTSLESISISNSSSLFRDNHNAAPYSPLHYSTARDKHELELDFRRFLEEFRSSSSEKEKEKALNMVVDVLCKLAKQHADKA